MSYSTTSTMRRSPIYCDDALKRPPPSPSSKAPPSKKPDSKSCAVSEELCPPSRSPSEPQPNPRTNKPPPARIIVDMEVFQQILDLDDEDSRDFSRDMVDDYLNQAQSTMKEMDDFFAKQDLTQLGKLGHFLKGSSAALGVVQVQAICEKIQHLGNRIDPDKDSDAKMSPEDALAKIKPLLARLKEEHATAAKRLKEEHAFAAKRLKEEHAIATKRLKTLYEP